MDGIVGTVVFCFILIFPALIISILIFFIPQQFLILYINWIIILALWSYAQVIQVPLDPNDDFIKLEKYLFWLNFVVASIVILFKIIIIYLKKERKEDNHKIAHLLKIINYFAFIITFTVYGLLIAYLLNLFHGDIFAGYQPAYQAYLIVIFSLLFFICIAIAQKIIVRLFKPIYNFSLSVCV